MKSSMLRVIPEVFKANPHELQTNSPSLIDSISLSGTQAEVPPKVAAVELTSCPNPRTDKYPKQETAVTMQQPALQGCIWVKPRGLSFLMPQGETVGMGQREILQADMLLGFT